MGYDSGKKTKGRKRFLLVDTVGYALVVEVTAANVGERDGGKALLETAIPANPWLKKIWVDGGFSGPDFAAHAQSIRSTVEVEVVERNRESQGFAMLPHSWILQRIFS